MKALVLSAFGSTDNFAVNNIPDPVLRQGQVLVRIAAASLNPIDNKIREGLPIGPALPAVLGCDFSGTIVEVGDNVSGYSIGDEVYGLAGGVKGHGGTLAELIAADARLIARKPRSLSMRQAAALPLVSISAWEAIARANLKASEQVLIHGAAGGVGHIAVQLAHDLGAVVTATVGKISDEAIVRGLGAEHVVFYRQEKPADYVSRITQGRGFPVVIDTVGGENLANSFQAAAISGRISTTASRTTLDLTPVHSKGLTFGVVFTLIPMLYDIGADTHGDILRQVATMVESGLVKPLIDERRFGLADAPAGYDFLQSGSAKGKIVIDVA
ncbi:zinc-dependent alcohol dehydrogenase family protein [Rhizobium sp.]|uniref:zinc-dependent alcohol dehydrogenase family protein n=1 Tax=Rhizobium sp. TaxID=391 RepID=UPI00289B8081